MALCACNSQLLIVYYSNIHQFFGLAYGFDIWDPVKKELSILVLVAFKLCLVGVNVDILGSRSIRHTTYRYE
mgnify:FL=1